MDAYRGSDYVSKTSDGCISFRNIRFRLRTYVVVTMRAGVPSPGPHAAPCTYMDRIFRRLTGRDLFCRWIMSCTWRKIRTASVSAVQRAFLAVRLPCRSRDIPGVCYQPQRETSDTEIMQHSNWGGGVDARERLYQLALSVKIRSPYSEELRIAV